MIKEQPIRGTGLEISGQNIYNITYRNPLIYISGISALNLVIFSVKRSICLLHRTLNPVALAHPRNALKHACL